MFRKTLILLGFKLINKYLVSRIRIVELRDYITALLEPISKVVDRLTDKDPDNDEQLMQLWAEEKHQLVEGSLMTACLIIQAEIKDNDLAQMICEMIHDAQEHKHLA